VPDCAWLEPAPLPGWATVPVLRHIRSANEDNSLLYNICLSPV
jgi:hypothetical protein